MQRFAFQKLQHRDVGKGATPFPGWLLFTLATCLIILSVKQGDIKYHFLNVFGMIRPGIEPRSPGPLANTVSTTPMSRLYIV